MRRLLAVCVICATLVWCACEKAKTGVDRTGQRSLEVRYVARITEIPNDAKQVRLWIPLPRDNMHQRIADLGVTCPFEYRITTEKRYGNRMIYVSAPDPPSDFDVEMRFKVVRLENTRRSGRAQGAGLIELAVKANRLVPLSGKISSLAMKIIQGNETLIDKARTLYDHTLDHMEYDKTGTGWGRGDFAYACDVGRGNCSDYHSYFIGLCRNAGIPAYFEIGLPIPAEFGEGDIGGYHCWAYFWDGDCWMPVDISEADKNPKMKEYFFGNLTENRVAFSAGRDIVLEPAPSGEPLNFFIYPYAEVDGRSHENVSQELRYRDLTSAED